MAVTRAETLTSSTKKTEYYSDIPNSFAQTPFGNELTKIINEKSITQSLKNLILTELGERLFQPTIGSDITAMLFEPNYRDYASEIELYVRSTIENHEPRAQVEQVLFPETFDETSVEITIIYRVINNIEPITLNLVLKRVR
jgi:phage baseplate assembly protein W